MIDNKGVAIIQFIYCALRITSMDCKYIHTQELILLHELFEDSFKLIHWLPISSILLDGSIDAANKDVGGIESNGSCEEPEASHHGEGVPKIEKGGNKIHNVELHREVNGQDGEL